ncbi:MAG: adenylate/guanylate cyclase domain-containing protein [Ramlibacter sp.]|nr:adenylate/guanylate cyclase domain-containing protein [Ramlibacter sp.]
MAGSRIVVVDSGERTAALLAAELSRRGFGPVDVVEQAAALPPLLAAAPVDAVIVNHRYQEDGLLGACNVVKQLASDCATLVASSSGPAVAAVRAFARQSGSVDAIVEKPFVDERFYLILTELLTTKAAARNARGRSERLARLVPAGALLSVGESGDPQAELFDAAVLFTDIRDSSRLITQMAPREFFDLLNQVLSEQTSRIHAGQGSIVKYTGDGVMAIFQGMGRSYLALRCGLELASVSRRQGLPYGVGIAQGLVLAGLLGDAWQTGQRRQFDVIGSTAHLAARLCARSEAGQVVATASINQVAQVVTPLPQPIEKVSFRGFEHPIDCVAFTPEPA